MRLFKYMSLASLRSILQHNTIGFSRAKDLNDPFDWPTAPDVPDYGFFESLTATLKGNIWAQNMGVCSMTRSAANSLMWAHYGDKHRGAVIEIDVDAAGLMCADTNAVPAHFGSVIYLNQPNMSQYAGLPNASEGAPGVSVGQLFPFRMDYYQQLQRLFLSKPLCWAYEEEVRIVKCLHGLGESAVTNQAGEFSIVERGDGSSMYAFHMPEQCITGIYFGINANVQEAQRIASDFGIKGSMIGLKQRGSYDVNFRPFEKA
ncbi:hypothetical protein M2337_002440 [Sphingobium sp. B2D3A]|uniref:DUF2971 domain-containing protein n=1 Tax=unclassified Sphingobium TaxID=2611147 RepID=UPI00222525E0|nr:MULTISPECIES: DUF2971 domain-containing protein [unclassified Sphingobium]MCW2338207.1 hypothetical protein [Sphingobium sp. B2D3A]MCW2384666.1 hypothetical protein [Sphingobium sp. B2D3D]